MRVQSLCFGIHTEVISECSLLTQKRKYHMHAIHPIVLKKNVENIEQRNIAPNSLLCILALVHKHQRFSIFDYELWSIASSRINAEEKEILIK